MSAERPNHIKLQRGETTVGFDFGHLRSVTPVHFAGAGLGHAPHVSARFEGGARFDWTPVDLVEFIRAAVAALRSLPAMPDFSDATWRGEDL